MQIIRVCEWRKHSGSRFSLLEKPVCVSAARCCENRLLTNGQLKGTRLRWQSQIFMSFIGQRPFINRTQTSSSSIFLSRFILILCFLHWTKHWGEKFSLLSEWTDIVQPGVLKRIFSANFQLSYFRCWTFLAALHNSKFRLILMCLIMAPLSFYGCFDSVVIIFHLLFSLW